MQIARKIPGQVNPAFFTSAKRFTMIDNAKPQDMNFINPKPEVSSADPRLREERDIGVQLLFFHKRILINQRNGIVW